MVRDEPGIAVLVLTLNEAARIRHLLDALKSEDFDEITVADGGSTDETVELVTETPGAGLVQAPRGRGPQINAAARATRSPIIVILHADTMLPANAPRIIREALAEPDIVAGCFRLSFDDAHPLLSAYAWASRFESPLTTFGDQAYFMRRSAFEAIGGAPEWLLLEDVRLREGLKRVGGFVKCPERVVTSARRFARQGPLRSQLRNFAILAGYHLGVPVSTLAAFYGYRSGAGTRPDAVAERSGADRAPRQADKTPDFKSRRCWPFRERQH